MSYAAWRIGFQDSEQAARSAYESATEYFGKYIKMQEALKALRGNSCGDFADEIIEEALKK